MVEPYRACPRFGLPGCCGAEHVKLRLKTLQMTITLKEEGGPSVTTPRYTLKEITDAGDVWRSIANPHQRLVALVQEMKHSGRHLTSQSQNELQTIRPGTPVQTLKSSNCPLR